MRTTIALLTVFTVWSLASAPARACGGFFCSATPIDQTAERIVFTVNGDGTISAYVQIRYAGERDAFAWLLPVPSTPSVDVFPALAIQALDLATEPVYAFPQCFPLALPEGSAGAGHDLRVIRGAVGPFDTAILESESSEAIVQWLIDNDYRFTEAMVPMIEPYVEAGMSMVAMKLLPDADVSDLQPVVLTYEAEQPMIPLQLTAVAAMPEMSIATWILADRRYEADNYGNIELSDEHIRFDESGNCTYQALVSREVDARDGRAFVTEYAKPTAELLERIAAGPVPATEEAQEANEALVELLSGHDYITRLYTRISPHEMGLDPTFAPAGSTEDFDNEHDLTEVRQDPICEDNRCEFLHCGATSACGLSETGAPTCLCGEGTAARITQNRFSVPEPFCEPRASDLSERDEATGAPTGIDGCADFSCGERGECININGSPACRCDVGYGAIVTARTRDGERRTELDCVVATVSEPGQFTLGAPEPDPIPPLIPTPPDPPVIAEPAPPPAHSDVFARTRRPTTDRDGALLCSASGHGGNGTSGASLVLALVALWTRRGRRHES